MGDSKFQKRVLPIPTAPEIRMNQSSSRGELTNSTHFIPVRPQMRSHGGGRRAPRPHSIGSTIISNPKLVKGWQYYDNDPSQTDMQKYFSSINLPPPPPEESESDGEDEIRVVDNARQYTAERHTLTGSTHTGEIKACVKPERRPCYGYIGIFLTIVASAALALSAINVKMLTQSGYSPSSLALWTFQGIFVPNLVLLLISCAYQRRNVVILYKRNGLDVKRGSGWITLSLIVTRAVFGLLGIVLKCYSLQYITVADSTIITFSAPVFVVIFACVLLRERLGVVPIITALVVVVGVGVITRPPMLTGEQGFDKDQLIGSAMAAGCMMAAVFTTLILRYVRHVHHAFINFVYGFIGTVGCLLFCWLKEGEIGLPQNANDWWLAGGIAVLIFIGQCLQTVALKYEQASTFSLIRTSEIPFIFAGQIILLDTQPSLLSLLGAGIVIFGVFVISARKWIEMQPPTSQARRWFGFMLK